MFDLSSIQPNYILVLPELVLVTFALIVLVWDLFTSEKRPLAYVSLLGIVLALVAVSFSATVPTGDYFAQMVRADPTTHFLKATFLVAAALVVLLSIQFIGRRAPKVEAEFYELLLFATLGMVFMAGSRDFVLIYLGLELSSQCSYILAGLLRKDPRSNEAALKYFLNGALASAVLLFGFSLLFGLSGTTHLPTMADRLGAAPLPLLLAGLVFVVAGFAFKIAAAPFHLWAPDAYEGAPTPVTAFFSVGPKGAAFAAILRVFSGGMPEIVQPNWIVLFAILSTASMFIGNMTALLQRNVKRMMAYSSISHAGYILVGVVAGLKGTGAVLFYILAYVLANLGIWAAIVAVENEGGGTDLTDFNGLAQRAPVLAWSLVFLFISLIGIPPTVGFFGKFFLFQAAVATGHTWLAIVMAVNSAISVGYYYAVVRNMFFEQGRQPALLADGTLRATVVISVLAVFFVALISGPFLSYAQTGAALILP